MKTKAFSWGLRTYPGAWHYVIGILIANENKGGVKNSLFAVEKLSLWEGQLSSLKPKTLSMGQTPPPLGGADTAFFKKMNIFIE